MGGEIWPFWGDLWEKMEPAARISAGVLIVEMGRERNMGCSGLPWAWIFLVLWRKMLLEAVGPKSLTEPSAERALGQMGVLLQFLVNQRQKCVLPRSLGRETVPRRAVKLFLELEAKRLLLPEQLVWRRDQGQDSERGPGPGAASWGGSSVKASICATSLG